MVNAEITVQSFNIPDVIPSNAPHNGNYQFNIVAAKTGGQDESTTIPIIVNGTTISSVNVSMKADETLQSVPSNITLPGETKLMINPFDVPKVPSNVQYTVQSIPFVNPISSIQYEVKIGGLTKNVKLLVYADWSLWAIIIDAVLVVAAILLLRRFILT